ncbi:methyl farnesoate epoxidase-like, partial [Cloeon dipterum]|uniref:methyl farnesoate epoxidase-like n=1 Tax=Cloeon dipterum TaxID=197152 RepID=UPI00321FA92D
MKKQPGDSPFDLTERLRKKYGDVVGLFLGPQPAVFINGYKCVKEISNMTEFAYRPNMLTPRHEIINKISGVFFSEGERWRNQRRFTLRHLRDFGFGRRTMDQYIQEEFNVLVAEVEKLAMENPGQQETGLNLMDLLPAVAINTLWYIIAGVKHDLHDENFHHLTKCVLKFFRLGDQNSPVNFYRVLQHVPVINRVYQEQRRCADELNNFVMREIQAHKKNFNESNVKDFIDIYLKEMQQDTTGFFTVSDEQLTTICVDLFLAGTETTASTIGFTLRYLIKYPHIQEKVRQEIFEVVGKHRAISMEDMMNLPYCTAVLTESLRHSGVTPFPPPKAPKEDTFFNGYLIPKRTMVMVNLRSVLMDEEYWGDPENFRPERFIGPDGNFKRDERLFLFGTG